MEQTPFKDLGSRANQVQAEFTAELYALLKKYDAELKVTIDEDLEISIPGIWDETGHCQRPGVIFDLPGWIHPDKL